MKTFEYAAPETNVFCANKFDNGNLGDFEVGKWYFADAKWNDFTGPFDSREEADRSFQQYVNNLRACPGCEE